MELIEGIVLKSSDFQEQSKIIQIYTKEHGLMGIYLKGANNYKNKNYQLAHPITHGSFHLRYNQNGLSTSYQGDVISGFRQLKINYEKNIFVFHLFELILKTIEPHIPNAGLYDFLLRVLIMINEEEKIAKVHLYTLLFEVKMWHVLGIAPVLDGCVHCQKPIDIVNFDIYSGGYVCRAHQDQSMRAFMLEAITSLRTLFYGDLNAIHELSDGVIQELRFIVNEYYAHHLGIRTFSMKQITTSS